MGSPLFRVLQPGLFSLLIGLPHPGRQRYGVPPGGAMDPTSFRMANLLVRNPTHARGLEISLLGPTVEVLSDCTLGLAGADLSATLNGEEVGNWTAFHAPTGGILKFGSLRCGARAYLAASGGLDLDRKYGATATAPRLAKGDLLLNAGEPTQADHPLIHLAEADRPVFANPSVLRILPGPHWERFSTEAQAALATEEFEVSHESNREGIRLKGPSLEYRPDAGADIISEPTPLGTIQIPLSGQPIILMVDRPTTGGYAKIATVISADIALAAQSAPKSKVRFEMTTLPEAQSASRELETRLHLLEQMATWHR